MKIALWYMCGFLSHKLECTFSKQNRREQKRTEPEQNTTEIEKREQARTEQNTT